jgi:hypothetical protein
MLYCDRSGCGLPRSSHSATPPHPSEAGTGAECVGYVPAWPCGKCGTDCELHDVDVPHPRPEVNCEGVDAPQGFEPGGGGYGGGGASGGW